MNKNFLMVKGCDGNVSEGNAAFGNPSRIEPNRSHNWFIDAAEFSNKKQAVQVPNGERIPGICNSVHPWENSSSFQSVPNQFIDRLFGSERDVSLTRSDNAGRKDIGDNFGKDAAVGLSMSRAREDPKMSFSYGGIKKVKINHVRDSHSAMFAVKDQNLSNKGISTLDAFNRENENTFISLNQSYDKEYDNITLMGHTYNKHDAGVRPMATSYSKDDEIPTTSIAHSKEVANTISFDRCIGTYESAYSRYSDKNLEATSEKQFDLLNSHQDASATRVAKSKPDSILRSKPQIKSSRKEAPNCFPSNVRTLISTGMVDGVPVKYVSLSREELCGIIKGSGYLCGCQSCNYSKVLNAYEFERHANCKTKHPNNHIYFENGKTIYQIVQELKNTPQSLLFDAIQTVFGAPINQKSFRSWKESYQAATRELQRIYGKEDLSSFDDSPRMKREYRKTFGNRVTPT